MPKPENNQPEQSPAFITFKVEPIDKSIKPFFLKSIQVPAIGYALQYQKKLYRVTGVFMDFDSGTITVIVGELNPIIKPKLMTS